MRMKLVLVVLGIGMMAFAAQKSYVVLTNRRPARTSCAEFVNNRSKAKWVELTGCELDLENAIGLQSRVLKIDKGLYVPIRPAGTTGPALILLKTDDEDPSAGIADEPGTDLPAASTRDDGEPRRPVKTVTGLVQSGLDDDGKARRALDKLAQQGVIKTGYTIIEAGKKPDPADLVLGLAFLIGIPVVGWFVLRGGGTASPPNVARTAPPPLPPAPPV